MSGLHTESTLRGAGNMELYCQSWEPPGTARASLVLVHGFGEHSSRYGYLVEALTAQGYTVSSIDHRGHGRSPGLRGHIDDWDDFAGDVHSLLESARARMPGAPLFLFGHSLGGLIVLNYAIRYPQGLAGVVASAPAVAPARISPLLIYTARLLSRVIPDFGLNAGLDVAAISRDPSEVQRYVSDPLVHERGTARFSTEIEEAVKWTQAHAGELDVPVLIYHGTGDRLVPLEGSRMFYEHVQVADKQFVEIPGGYHESHNDLDRQKVFALILSWLDAH